MMLSDVPNLVLAFGYTNASWTLKADLTAEYVCRLLRYMDRHGYRSAAPHVDPTVQTMPFLDFSSGYVQRAASVLPRQGDRRPWRVYQNYFMDMMTIRHGRIAMACCSLIDKAPRPCRRKMPWRRYSRERPALRHRRRRWAAGTDRPCAVPVHVAHHPEDRSRLAADRTFH
jgi:hypothetical protein